MDIHQELKELSKFLSEYSTSLMAVGVQTSRIVRNTSRIAESFGFFCDMTIFQKTIIMTLRDADNSHSYSTVNKIKPMGLNFAINSALSTLSWEAYDEFFVRTELMGRHWNHLAILIISSFIASMIGSTGYLMHWGDTPDMALGTSVLYLIPGVPLINAIMDIIDGHVLAGTSRFINACLLIICIAIGLSMTLLITGISTL